MIIKCKMCGGDIEISQDMTVGTCRYCGSTMTLPRIESEKKARLFNRANEYRLNNEFDKAYDAYRSIVDEDEQEAEAYWGMLLSEYGVEYVEDNRTGKRIPTCHRTCVQSIQSSSNYKLACQYADTESKLIYQDEAECIDKLQRTILSVSSKESPYDVFICYKETNDVTGERTKDSVLAQDIYNELEKNGIRTFFSRISLETHLGENYEPYIYAALKSARVMLLVSTSGDNCEAVWVKNEWSRFMSFMSDDDSKVLIPVYQDITPYDFPRALSGFQAQDMSKIGAIQDLVYGIKKILGTARTSSRDNILDSLLEDKLNREKRERKTKRIVVILFVALILLLLGILFYIVFYPKLQKSYWDSRVIEVESGYPSTDDYSTFYVWINDREELFDYLEKDAFSGGFYSPKGAEEGWIYVSAAGLNIYWWTDNNAHREEFPGVMRGIAHTSVKVEQEGALYFKSLDSIKKWDEFRGFINIYFKDDTEISISSSEDISRYYLYVLQNYVPEKCTTN